MTAVSIIQVYLFLGIALVGLGLQLWALVHAALTPAGSFEAADKRTKVFWMAVLGGATIIGFLGLPAPLGGSFIPIFLVLIAIAPAGVYLADVKPAVTRYRRPPQRRDDRW